MAKARALPKSLKGHVAELLVEAYAILSAGGRLAAFGARSDVDHKDFIVDEVGGYRNAYAQVKCATHLDAEGHIVCTAHYPKNKVPSHPRFIYIFCLLDESRMELTRIWFVPSRDFNRLAYREPRGEGRVQLLFECLASGDRRWDRYEVSRDELGGRFIELIERAAGGSPKALPGVRISLRPRERFRTSHRRGSRPR